MFPLGKFVPYLKKTCVSVVIPAHHLHFIAACKFGAPVSPFQASAKAFDERTEPAVTMHAQSHSVVLKIYPRMHGEVCFAGCRLQVEKWTFKSE